MWTDELRARIDAGTYKVDYGKLQRYFKVMEYNLTILDRLDTAASLTQSIDIFKRLKQINDFLGNIEANDEA